MNVMFDQFCQLPFQFHSHDRLPGLTIEEENQCRDALYAKATSCLRIVVDIQLGDFDPALVVVGQ